MVSGGLEQQCRIRTDATGSSGVDGRVDNKDGSVEGAGDGGRFSGEGARMDELRDGVETSVIEDGVLDNGVGDRSEETGVGEGTLGGSEGVTDEDRDVGIVSRGADEISLTGVTRETSPDVTTVVGLRKDVSNEVSSPSGIATL